jgi:hypothetical protein
MKRSLLNFLLVLAPLLSLAHDASVKGKAMSSYTKVALRDISVMIKGTDIKTSSDSLGYYQFLNIPARNYTLVFEKKGYFRTERYIDLKGDQQHTLDVYLSPEMIDLPSITAATARNTSASSSSLVSAIDMELRQRNSAQDMLRLVPGLFIAQHQGGGKAEQIFVRGFDCDHGTDIATFVDGVPVNMPSHGHGQGYADLHFLIPEVTKSMEIFKGPYQAQYGDFATGAAVTFNTYDSLPTNMVKVEISSTPTQRAISSGRILAMVNIPSGISKLSSYAAAEYSYTPGYFDINSKYSRFNIFGKLKYRFSPSSDVALSVASSAGSWNGSGQIPERALAEHLIDRFGTLDLSEGGNTSRTNINLQFRNLHGSSLLTTNLYYINYQFKLYSDFTFNLLDSARGDGIEQDDSRSVLGFNIAYAKYYDLGRISTKSTFGAGFRSDFVNNSLWHQQNRIRISNTSMADINESASTLYFKQDFNFTNWFRADIAIRGDYFIFNVDDLHRGDSAHHDISGYNYQFLPSYKLNLIFTLSKNAQLFINNGIGYHSNDARSVVQDKDHHILPIAFGAEVGTQVRIGSRAIITAALWMMDLTNELVYSGDAGTTEDNGSSRRMGIDLSARVQLTKWLTADADLNYAYNYLTDNFLGAKAAQNFYLPLAPIFTTQGGFTARHHSGFKARLGYRAMTDRPANETNSVVAKGYCVVDALMAYERRKYQISLTIENLLNTKWNEAQFDTESRLRNEEKAVDELHFTAGTPIAFKLGFSYFF